MADKKRVLVVEDDPIAYATVYDILEQDGYDVVSAANSKQVRWSFAEGAPHVVLLNAHLSSENGVGILVLIRQHPEGGEVPVVAITYENVDIDFQRQLEQYGVTDFVTRPLEQKRLLACVGALTGRSTEPVRRNRRYRAMSEVQVQLPSQPDFVRFEVRDVSTEGVFLQSDDPIAPLSRVRIRITTASGSVVELDGRVAHVLTAEIAAQRGVDPGMGIKLTAMTDEQRACFEDFCARARKTAELNAPPATASQPEIEPPPDSQSEGDRPSGSPLYDSDSQSGTPRVVAKQRRASREDLQMATVLRNQLMWLRDSDEHEALGVPYGSDRRSIEAAFVALRKEYHPDRYAHHDYPRIAELSKEIVTLLEQAAMKLLEDADETPDPYSSSPVQVALSEPPPRLSWQSRGSASPERRSRGGSRLSGAGPASVRPSRSPVRRPSRGGGGRAPSSRPARSSRGPSSIRPPSRTPAPSSRSVRPTPQSVRPTGPGAAGRRSASPPKSSSSAPPPSVSDTTPPPSSSRGAQSESASGFAGPPSGAEAMEEAARRAADYYDKGVVAIDQKRLRDARNLISQAAKLDPQPKYEAGVEFVRGLLYREKGMLSEALEQMKRAFKLDRRSSIRDTALEIQDEMSKGKKKGFGGLFGR